MTRPVLLLDVDGVLNIVGPDYHERMVRLPGDGHPFYPTPHVLPFMRWAWARFEVVWNTAWRGSANQIADWAGLPRAFAITETDSYRRRQERLDRARGRRRKRLARRMDVPSLSWFRDRGDWKVDGAKEYIGPRRCQVLWIEDGLSPEGHAWVGTRPRTCYVATDSFEGVTPSHVRILAQLAGLRPPPWTRGSISVPDGGRRSSRSSSAARESS